MRVVKANFLTRRRLKTSTPLSNPAGLTRTPRLKSQPGPRAKMAKKVRPLRPRGPATTFSRPRLTKSNRSTHHARHRPFNNDRPGCDCGERGRGQFSRQLAQDSSVVGP